jgi:hypothetical protein
MLFATVTLMPSIGGTQTHFLISPIARNLESLVSPAISRSKAAFSLFIICFNVLLSAFAQLKSELFLELHGLSNSYSPSYACMRFICMFGLLCVDFMCVCINSDICLYFV